MSHSGIHVLQSVFEKLLWPSGRPNLRPAETRFRQRSPAAHPQSGLSTPQAGAAGQEQETGSVIWVGDGIAIVYGIEHAMYGEIVIFENGVKGMVQDIRKNEIGCILFGKDTGVGQGTKVVRTRKRAGVPVGNGFLGRVVNALGEPIDGLGPVKEEDYRGRDPPWL